MALSTFAVEIFANCTTKRGLFGDSLALGVCVGRGVDVMWVRVGWMGEIYQTESFRPA